MHLVPALNGLCEVVILSRWFLIMSQGPARAGFLGPGRITLGAHFRREDGDPQSARGSLLRTTPIVVHTKP